MSGSPDPALKKPSITFIAFHDEVALGLRTLQAILSREGYRARIIFFQGWRQLGTWPSETQLENLFSLLDKERSDIFGLSFRSFMFPLAKRVTEEIRRRKGAKVIWGGSHPTLVPEQCIEVADVVCVGEGEEAIIEFMRAIEAGGDFSGIPNLWVRTEDGVSRNPIRPLLQDIDSVPWPLFGNEDKITVMGDQVTHGDLALGGMGPTTYYILGSRGCPYACDYCCNSALRDVYSGAGPFIRKRSPQNIIAELERAKKGLDVHFVAFMDELITLDKSWTLEICSLYRDRIGIPFTAEVHPNTVDGELARALGDAGIRIAVIGVQSGSERVRRDIYNRRISNREILEAGRLMHAQGALVHYDFIFDNPYETRADLGESFKLLLDIPRPYFLEQMSLAFFPRTRITERALEDGLIPPDEVEGTADKPIKTFLHRFAQARDGAHAFYSMLFWLSQLKFSFRHLRFYAYGLNEELNPVHVIPLPVLKMMERSRRLQDEPERLDALNRFFLVKMNQALTPLRWIKTTLELILEGRFSELAHRIKSRSGGSA